MKKKILSTLFAFTMVFGVVFSITPLDVFASPCPTGVSEVDHSWWPPSNDTYYTMCNCDAVDGTTASGSC